MHFKGLLFYSVLLNFKRFFSMRMWAPQLEGVFFSKIRKTLISMGSNDFSDFIILLIQILSFSLQDYCCSYEIFTIIVHLFISFTGNKKKCLFCFCGSDVSLWYLMFLWVTILKSQWQSWESLGFFTVCTVMPNRFQFCQSCCWEDQNSARTVFWPSPFQF